VRFFFDNNLSPKLARSLNALVEPERQVVHLKERFAANTADEIWMRTLASEPDWVIISGDLRIRKNPHEILAWREAGHTTFFLKKGWIALTFWDQGVEVCQSLSRSDTRSRACAKRQRFLRYSQHQSRVGMILGAASCIEMMRPTASSRPARAASRRPRADTRQRWGAAGRA
jgi:hypothetical protein